MRRCGILFVLSLSVGLSASVNAADPPATRENEREFSQAQRSHWSFVRPVRQVVPAFDSAEDRGWVRNPVDAFVLAKLKQNRLRPAPQTDRRTFLRRVTFDLTGLPPTPEEVRDFVGDTSSLAFTRLIDRLLASPRYGERWGQHWLDVVRFAETEGFEYDRHHESAWRYRDYVIRSFNDDKPYDRFVMEQLAGDELAEASLASGGETSAGRAAQIAAGFHRLGPVRRNAGNAEVAFSRNEVLTERTNIIGAAFLGLTVGCARCHDHMYDPIPQNDYYRLQAYLAATYEYDIPLADKKTVADWNSRNDQIEAEIKRIKKSLEDATGEPRQKLETELKAVELRRPKPLPEIFSVRNVAEKRTPIHLLERGDENKKGERLGMRPLGVLVSGEPADLPADSKWPKTELAHWLLSPDNPLTSRVMVNRIWQYHFGRGLVRTPNDFGANGSAPSHPELLDWLANRFVKHGWSIKAMHRLILLSSTYRQASRMPSTSAGREADAENRFLWRFSRRRLSAEEIRDAMLAVSGRLNRQAGGPSVMIPVEKELIGLLYKPTQWQVTADAAQHDRRSIYLIAKRNLRLPFMDLFDQPDRQISCDRRESSTHAPQALELLNGRLSNELAAAFADRLARDAGEDQAKQIELAFQLAAGRLPTQSEKRLALEFLRRQPLSELSLAMFNLNAFLYVD